MAAAVTTPLAAAGRRREPIGHRAATTRWQPNAGPDLTDGDRPRPRGSSRKALACRVRVGRRGVAAPRGRFARRRRAARARGERETGSRASSGRPRRRLARLRDPPAVRVVAARRVLDLGEGLRHLSDDVVQRVLVRAPPLLHGLRGTKRRETQAGREIMQRREGDHVTHACVWSPAAHCGYNLRGGGQGECMQHGVRVPPVFLQHRS